jgi:hypothetical protein
MNVGDQDVTPQFNEEEVDLFEGRLTKSNIFIPFSATLPQTTSHQ